MALSTPFVIPIRKKNATNRPFVETRFIASLRKDVLQSLIELVLLFELLRSLAIKIFILLRLEQG
ncbi:hypothetical protein [Nostoc sp.]|uniref:hypothetical protein n=1 Tax=Nostoc sp. TaxID=1180 RepID=UPI002FFB56F5